MVVSACGGRAGSRLSGVDTARGIGRDSSAAKRCNAALAYAMERVPKNWDGLIEAGF